MVTYQGHLPMRVALSPMADLVTALSPVPPVMSFPHVFEAGDIGCRGAMCPLAPEAPTTACTVRHDAGHRHEVLLVCEVL